MTYNAFRNDETIIKKYKTFSVLIYSYINTSGNWKNKKLCGNTTPAGRSVFYGTPNVTIYQQQLFVSEINIRTCDSVPIYLYLKKDAYIYIINAYKCISLTNVFIRQSY